MTPEKLKEKDYQNTKASKEDKKRKLEDQDQQVPRKQPKVPRLEPSKPSGLPPIVTDHSPSDSMDFCCVLCNKLFATAKEIFNHTKENHMAPMPLIKPTYITHKD